MPQAIPVIITVAQVAMTAYSAVNAVKALKEGNILGAIAGGFGAYMGMTSLGTGTATQGVTQTAATETAGAAAEAGVEGISEAAVGDTFAGFATEGSMPAIDTTSALATVGDVAGVEGVLGGVGDVTASIGQAIPSGSVMTDMGDIFTSGIEAVKQGAKDLGNVIQGNLESQGDGTFLDTATGNLFDEGGNLLKAGQIAAGYMAKKDANEQANKRAKEGREAMQQEAADVRRRKGAATTYVPPSLLRGA